MTRNAMLGLAVGTALLGTASAGEPTLTDTLLERETRLLDAIRDKDEAKVNELLGSQVLSVSKSGRRTTPEVVKLLAATELTSCNITDPQAIVVSDGVAILTYKYSWSGTQDGKPYDDATYFATVVWVHRDGDWRSVFYQETEAED